MAHDTQVQQIVTTIPAPNMYTNMAAQTASPEPLLGSLTLRLISFTERVTSLYQPRYAEHTHTHTQRRRKPVFFCFTCTRNSPPSSSVYSFYSCLSYCRDGCCRDNAHADTKHQFLALSETNPQTLRVACHIRKCHDVCTSLTPSPLLRKRITNNTVD